MTGMWHVSHANKLALVHVARVGQSEPGRNRGEARRGETKRRRRFVCLSQLVLGLVVFVAVADTINA